MQHNFLYPELSCDLSAYIIQGVLTPLGIKKFRKIIYDYYAQHERIFAWRHTPNAYFVVVSEIMLQQTQTDRVKDAYERFITAFPTLESLASAPLKDIFALWQGLGYNRRALALQQFAQQVVAHYGATVPQEPELLRSFKGIGPNTAGSISAFAFNRPTVFIETNIRSVFIHCFFNHRTDVTDAEIRLLVETTLDTEQPRIWYYALMDYGVMLKKLYKNPSRKSAHHTVQSRFEGSDRQIRGHILKLLVEHNALTLEQLITYSQKDPERVTTLIDKLVHEHFIKKVHDTYLIA